MKDTLPLRLTEEKIIENSSRDGKNYIIEDELTILFHDYFKTSA